MAKPPSGAQRWGRINFSGQQTSCGHQRVDSNQITKRGRRKNFRFSKVFLHFWQKTFSKKIFFLEFFSLFRSNKFPLPSFMLLLKRGKVVLKAEQREGDRDQKTLFSLHFFSFCYLRPKREGKLRPLSPCFFRPNPLSPPFS